MLRSGIAAFKVTPNGKRPFVVTSDLVTTRVTGTEFVVDRQRSDHIEVAVLEGRVEVSGPAEQNTTLTAEQTVSIAGDVMMQVSHRPSAQMGEWRDGVLHFVDRPILEALYAIQPYTRYELDVQDVADHPGLVSGVFFVERANEALFTLLETQRMEAHLRGANTLQISNQVSRPE